MRTLDTLRVGESALVRGILAEGGAARRLGDMGLTPGAEVTVLRAAPFGDPLVLSLHGYRLALRRREAATVVLEP